MARQFTRRATLLRSAVQLQSRVHVIDVLLVQVLPQTLQRLAEALEVNDFLLPQELQHVVDIWVIAEEGSGRKPAPSEMDFGRSVTPGISFAHYQTACGVLGTLPPKPVLTLSNQKRHS